MSYDIRSFRLGTECMIVHFTLEPTISGQLQLLCRSSQLSRQSQFDVFVLWPAKACEALETGSGLKLYPSSEQFTSRTPPFYNFPALEC